MDLFLEQYSLEELAQMSRNPEEVARSIQKAVRSSYRLDKVVEDSIDTILTTSITVIRTFQKQMKEIDKSIKRIMVGVQQTLHSRPYLALARYL